MVKDGTALSAEDERSDMNNPNDSYKRNLAQLEALPAGDQRRAAIPRLVARIAASAPKTDCGGYWTNLKSGCIACNPNGEHYHFADGGCDTEPCYRHGGPA